MNEEIVVLLSLLKEEQLVDVEVMLAESDKIGKSRNK